MVLPDDWQAGESAREPLRPRRPGARGGGDSQSPRLPVDPRTGAQIAAITGAPFDEELPFRTPGASDRSTRTSPSKCATPICVPATRPSDPRGDHHRVTPMAQGPHMPRRHATDQQCGRYHQLRAVDPGSAPACLRSRHIRGGRIIVRRAYPGETIVTLDNETRADRGHAGHRRCRPGLGGRRYHGRARQRGHGDAPTDILLEGANFAGPVHHADLGCPWAYARKPPPATRRAWTRADTRGIGHGLQACSWKSAVGPSRSGTIDVRGAAAPTRTLRCGLRGSSRCWACVPPPAPVGDTCAPWAAPSTPCGDDLQSPSRLPSATSSARSTWSRKSPGSTAWNSHPVDAARAPGAAGED